MKYLVAILISFLSIWGLAKISKIVIEDIKKDPIANLLLPVATSILTYAILRWL